MLEFRPQLVRFCFMASIEDILVFLRQNLYNFTMHQGGNIRGVFFIAGPSEGNAQTTNPQTPIPLSTTAQFSHATLPWTSGLGASLELGSWALGIFPHSDFVILFVHLFQDTCFHNKLPTNNLRNSTPVKQ